MVTHRALFHVVVIVAFGCAGCTPVIHIVQPDRNNADDPVTQGILMFDTKWSPANPWHVDIDGTNVTGFSPAPAPGGTSTFGIPALAAGSHTITASATCGTFCAYSSDQVTFRVPRLSYNSTSFFSTPQNLKQFQPTDVWVGVQNYSSKPITVTIVETSLPHHVKLAPYPSGAFLAPGVALPVIINAGTTRADFRIEGDVLGTYVLQFTAAGAENGGGSGTISP